MAKSRSSGMAFDRYVQNLKGDPSALTCFQVSLASGKAFMSNIFPAKMRLDGEAAKRLQYFTIIQRCTRWLGTNHPMRKEVKRAN